jgi:hypothetical protein
MSAHRIAVTAALLLLASGPVFAGIARYNLGIAVTTVPARFRFLGSPLF